MVHNPALNCNIAAASIQTMHENAAAFENIFVTLNGDSQGSELLGTSCRARHNRYTVRCFHEDDWLEIGSGGSIPLMMIMICIIFALLAIIAFLCYKLRRERRKNYDLERKFGASQSTECRI